MEEVQNTPTGTHLVKFNISYPDIELGYKTFEVSKELALTSSIRAAVIDILSNLKNNIPNLHLGNFPTDIRLSIFISDSSIKNAHDGWKNTHEFGLSYVLLSDGSLRILNSYEPLTHDWKLSELVELTEEGYISGDPYHVIIGIPQGLGAGGTNVIQWVGFICDIWSLSMYSGGIIKRIWFYFRLRSIRKVTKKWTERGILYPEQLRKFIDTKSEWKIEEVAKRLNITLEFSNNLLTALGLEPIKNGWRITHTNSSIAKRKAWMRNERKYEIRRRQELERQSKEPSIEI